MSKNIPPINLLKQLKQGMGVDFLTFHAPIMARRIK